MQRIHLTIDERYRLRRESEIIAEGVQRCPEVLHDNVGADPQNSDEGTEENQLDVAGSVFRCPNIRLLDGLQPRPTWERIP